VKLKNQKKFYSRVWMWHEIQGSGTTEITFPEIVEQNNQSNHVVRLTGLKSYLFAHLPGRARSKNAAACGWTAYFSREAGRHCEIRKVADNVNIISHVVSVP